MSKSSLSFEDVLFRINNNFNKANSKNENRRSEDQERSGDYNHLQLQFTTELEQVNRRWDVSPEFYITSHRRSIGKFIVFGKKVIRKLLRWYVNPVFEKQKGFNASVTRTLNIVKELTSNQTIIINNLVEEKGRMSDEIKLISDKLEIILQEKEHLESENIRLSEFIEQLLESHKLSILSTEKDNIDKFALVFDHVEALKQQLSIEHNQQLLLNEKIENTTDELLGYVRRKLKKVEKNTHYVALNEKTNNDLALSEIDNNYEYSMDYILFENKFRGSRKVIKERQKEYLQYISKTDRVLDIGCGRGEFIELLTENGISSEGIDINEDMVSYCLERGFNVRYADAIQYLSTVPAQSFDCITMSQVIEHLTFEQYTQLLTLIHSALKPGGRIIIETINVQSVYAMSNWFYIDPTHTKPVHPETLDFVIKDIGFYKTERKNLSPVEHIKIPKLDIEYSEELNNALKDLYGMIYGYQDYAIVAWR